MTDQPSARPVRVGDLVDYGTIGDVVYIHRGEHSVYLLVTDANTTPTLLDMRSHPVVHEDGTPIDWRTP